MAIKKHFRLEMLATALAFGLTVVGCDNGFITNNETQYLGQQDDSLQKYDYVFRIIDLKEGEREHSFARQIAGVSDDLQKLAVYFDHVKNSNARSVNNDSILAKLAQSAVTAYSTPEVLGIIDDLAANGVYIQFAYKEFLVDQCIVPENARSAGMICYSVPMNVMSYDGFSNDPVNWEIKNAVVKMIAVDQNARAVSGIIGDQSVTLAIAEDRKELVSEYAQYYTDALYTSDDVVITEQPDGTYTVSNGVIISTIEFADVQAGDARGLFSAIKNGFNKVVNSVKTAFQNHPITTVLAIGATVVGIAVSGGLITLPAGLTISGSGLVGTIGITLFF